MTPLAQQVITKATEAAVLRRDSTGAVEDIVVAVLKMIGDDWPIKEIDSRQYATYLKHDCRDLAQALRAVATAAEQLES